MHMYTRSVSQGIIRSRPFRNVLTLWLWSTACSAWMHMWCSNVTCYQLSCLSGVRLWSLITLHTLYMVFH